MMLAPDFHIPPPVATSVQVLGARAEIPHFGRFSPVGTGGIADGHFMRNRHGHEYASWLGPGPMVPTRQQPARSLSVAHSPALPDSALLMQEIQAGFGRTFSSLPAVFGVSRQTLYNWLKGDRPKVGHEARLQQLAAAAREFSRQAFKPTPQALHRNLERGLSLIELIAEGQDGKRLAERLIRLETAGQRQRSRLDALLASASTREDEPEVVRRAFDEMT